MAPQILIHHLARSGRKRVESTDSNQRFAQSGFIIKVALKNSTIMHPWAGTGSFARVTPGIEILANHSMERFGTRTCMSSYKKIE